MTIVLCYYVIKNWKINKNKILIIIIIIMTIIIILLCLLYLWKSQDLSDIVRTVAGYFTGMHEMPAADKGWCLYTSHDFP